MYHKNQKPHSNYFYYHYLLQRCFIYLSKNGLNNNITSSKCYLRMHGRSKTTNASKYRECVNKMLKIKKVNGMPFTYVSLAETSINNRIEYIINPLMDTQFKIPAKIAEISCVSFYVIFTLFIVETA